MEFPPSPTLAEMEISISITDDEIQEPEELFLLYLEVIESSDTGLTVDRNVSVARIRSDENDSKTFNSIQINYGMSIQIESN